MFCRNCGASMADNQAVCLNCGVKKGVGNQFCPNCGAQTNANAAICIKCGVALSGGGVSGGSSSNTNWNGDEINGHNKYVLALLAFFLGGFGIHNFILGESKKGVARILFTFLGCGIGLIFALIDCIKLLTGSYVVDPTKII